MEKTKLGLSVAVMGAVVYLTALFGGYTPLLLVAGYVLIAEESAQLKKNAVTAFLVMLAFSAVNFVVGLLPDILNLFYSFLQIFKVYVHLSFIDNIANFLYNAVALLRQVVLAALAILSLLKKPVNVPFVKKLSD